MPINVNELYKFVQFVANKEQSGFVKPEEFNIAADRAQMQFFMERYNNPAEYQPGRPVPRVAFQQTQKVSDDLRIFMVNETITSPQSILALSANYVHLISLRKTDGSHIKLLDDYELGHVLNSALTPPSNMYPVASIIGDSIVLYGTGSANLTYLRRPEKPFWEYLKNVNGEPVDSNNNLINYPIYDSTNSVDLEFPDETFNEIAIRILSFVGINLRENQLTQYTELKKQQGI